MDHKHQFDAELTCLTLLDHPNVTRLFARASDQNELMLLEEYVDGKTMATYIKDCPFHGSDEEIVRFQGIDCQYLCRALYKPTHSRPPNSRYRIYV